MKKTLIVIDMQNDFVYGPLGTPEAKAIVPNVKKKIEEYRERFEDVVFTKDSHEPGYLDTHEGRRLPIKHCMWDDPRGSELVITPEWGESLLHKDSFGAMDLQHLTYVKQSPVIEVIGVCTDICVVSNALLLRTICPEADIIVDASCCAGTTPERHKAALEVMKSCHIDVINEGGESND